MGGGDPPKSSLWTNIFLPPSVRGFRTSDLRLPGAEWACIGPLHPVQSLPAQLVSLSGRPGAGESRPEVGWGWGIGAGTLTVPVTLVFPLKFSLSLPSLIEISKGRWALHLAHRSASECRKDLFLKKVLNSSMIFLLERQLRIIMSALLRAD